MRIRNMLLASLCAASLCVGTASAAVNDMNEATDTATAVTDRHNPAKFESGVDFDGKKVLQIDTAVADGADNRAPGLSGGFYDTQGKKWAVPLSEMATILSADVWIGADDMTSGLRNIGIWGTGVDALGAVKSYAIVEHSDTDNGSGARDGGFDVWNGAGWIDAAFASGPIAYDRWYRFGMEIVGGNYEYTVSDLQNNVLYAATTGANGALYFDEYMVQAYNTKTGRDSTHFVDQIGVGEKLAAVSAVPEPGTWALMIAGFGLMGSALRRRRHEVLA